LDDDLFACSEKVMKRFEGIKSDLDGNWKNEENGKNLKRTKIFMNIMFSVCVQWF